MLLFYLSLRLKESNLDYLQNKLFLLKDNISNTKENLENEFIQLNKLSSIQIESIIAIADKLSMIIKYRLYSECIYRLLNCYVPDNTEIQIKLAKCLYNLGDFNSAERELNEILKRLNNKIDIENSQISTLKKNILEKSKTSFNYLLINFNNKELIRNSLHYRLNYKETSSLYEVFSLLRKREFWEWSITNKRYQKSIKHWLSIND